MSKYNMKPDNEITSQAPFLDWVPSSCPNLFFLRGSLIRKLENIEKFTENLLSVSGKLDVMEELVDVSVVTEGGRGGYSPIAAVV